MRDDTPYETIGFRAPVDVKERAAKDANRLGMTTAEYGRMAIERLLDAEVTSEEADPYRAPPTKKELRERARANGNGAASQMVKGVVRGTGPLPTRAPRKRPAPLARTDVRPIPKTVKR